MITQIIEAIRTLDFNQAEQVWKGSGNKKEISDAVLEWSFDTESVVSYTFAQHLIAKNQDNIPILMEGHDLAIELLIHPICHIEGAYYSALYHTREMIKLTNHQDLGYLEYLLFLNEVPDHVVPDEEAEKTSRYILSKEPKNLVAKEWLKSRK